MSKSSNHTPQTKAKKSLVPAAEIFRIKAYSYYWVMRVLNSAVRQMFAVAIGWQVYDLARLEHSVRESALYLGMIGLTQFLPVLALSLIGGQVADRFDRKIILIIVNLGRIVTAGLLFCTVLLPPQSAMILIFGVALCNGVLAAFSPAASSSLYPTLVPRKQLHDAIAWNSLGFQVAAISGPAIGGLIYFFGPQYVYAMGAVMSLIATISIYLCPTPKHVPKKNARGLAMIIEGLRYVKNNKIVLGAISLDLVVVLFGGVTALLPIFARDILHVGTFELGLMRAAPAFGAAIIAFWLAMRPLTRNIGKYLLIAIFIYGIAMFGFALSRVLWISMFALAVTGAADMISVYIRQSLVQLSTPDNMRGRVTSVDFIFIAASNELGEFESGVAARFIGPVGAVILGSGMAIACALVWPKLFPEMSKADEIEVVEG